MSPSKLIPAVFDARKIVNERESAILAHCARAPGRRYGAPSAPTYRFNEGSGVGPARACSLVGKKRQLVGDVGERFLEIGHGDAQEADALGRGQERAYKLDARLTQEDRAWRQTRRSCGFG